MSAFNYQTIERPSEGIYKEKGSRFLAFAYPVDNEGEIKARLQELRKNYFDARHHCFAWMLGPEQKSFRANDDGEPNHSAGDPILGQIRSKNLTNVLVVVVRYFGGVKLGVGGLIAAYKLAAEDALKNATIIEKEVLIPFSIQYDYNATPEVMRMVKDFELQILHQAFEEECVMRGEMALKMKEKFVEKVVLLKALGSKIEIQIQ
jgi:uncharacterized YigZ family protein